MIEEKKLYPITILGPTKKELVLFSKNSLMIAKDLVDMPVNEVVNKTGISIKRIIILRNLARQVIS
jgi:hypothetical protein